MIDFFIFKPSNSNFNCCIFCFLLNGLGAGTIFLFKKNIKENRYSLSIAAGIMLASTFFSLIMPALNKDGISYCINMRSWNYTWSILLFLGR